MRKEIKKVTSWFIVFAAILCIFLYKETNKGISSVATSFTSSSNENSSDGGKNSEQIKTAFNYSDNDEIGSSSDLNQMLNKSSIESKNSNNPTIVDLSSSKPETSNMEVAVEDTKSSLNEFSQVGPNNTNTDNFKAPTQNNTVSSNNTDVASAENYDAGSSATRTASATSSTPVIVTAPGGPGGGGGGGGSTDPFAVPLDDYYGLIFLLVTSTLVGVFTLRKVKAV